MAPAAAVKMPGLAGNFRDFVIAAVVIVVILVMEAAVLLIYNNNQLKTINIIKVVVQEWQEIMRIRRVEQVVIKVEVKAVVTLPQLEVKAMDW